MSRLRVSLDELLPIKQAVRALPRALDRLERADTPHLVITKRNRPRAVLISVERYERLLAYEEPHSTHAV
jgi:PHD/YefM family antitoxin component YafN of YafNO toxin-antitoxin module